MSKSGIIKKQGGQNEETSAAKNIQKVNNRTRYLLDTFPDGASRAEALGNVEADIKGLFLEISENIAPILSNIAAKFSPLKYFLFWMQLRLTLWQLRGIKK